MHFHLLRAWAATRNGSPLYWKRKDYHDVVYRTEEAKLRAIVLEILKFHLIGRPMFWSAPLPSNIPNYYPNACHPNPLRRLC